MPLISIVSDQAISNSRNNPNKNWPNRKDGKNRVEPLTVPSLAPNFVITKEDAVFTVGSCFARNVEIEMERQGFNVPMRNLDLSISDEDEGAIVKTGAVFNNYAVPSILSELTWALDPKNSFDPDVHLLKIGDDKYHDLHLTNIAKPRVHVSSRQH